MASFEKSLNGPRVATAFALGAVLVTSSCDNSPQQQDPLLANGWVTNCSGADFGKADTHRPIFRISDQLVLAVPPANHPSSNSIERVPRACEKISDLPVAAFVSFVVTGDWSSGYNQADIPTNGGIKQFQPDVVGARVEREAPSKQSAEDQRYRNELIKGGLEYGATQKREIGLLSCFVPGSWGYGWLYCSGHRAEGDPDVTALRVRKYANTPFELLLADYVSSRYGGIHVYWQVWVKDETHVLDIDTAIWKSIEGWNLANIPAK